MSILPLLASSYLTYGSPMSDVQNSTGAVLDYTGIVIKKKKVSMCILVNEFMMFVWNVYMTMSFDT